MNAPTLHLPLTLKNRSLHEKFHRLADQWRTERGTSSHMAKIHLQPSYQQIIGLGPNALPLILEEMNRSPDFWFWALRSITGEDPVPVEHAGNLQAMTQDWLQWARVDSKDRPITSKSPQS